jgi:hypothetical protein
LRNEDGLYYKSVLDGYTQEGISKREKKRKEMMNTIKRRERPIGS